MNLYLNLNDEFFLNFVYKLEKEKIQFYLVEKNILYNEHPSEITKSKGFSP